ncbi:hypothetical protein PVK06_020248 [Gossypium arboreum]|uniref:RNase H type-1 domain-containing protein n=1 Tax=Gossypium arboreum TaxID=29729 RepID=A0ABR0PMC0_GOSAR|nr:hypothetical protein PVK06_020248 [Gossypium arboreum]
MEMQQHINGIDKQFIKHSWETCWRLPEVEWYKVNTDGARMLETGHASSGSVIRDDHRRWKMGFSQKIGICSTVEFELWGAYDGLGHACHMGARKVILELDNLEVVHMLLQPMSKFPHFVVARDVKRLIQNQ